MFTHKQLWTAIDGVAEKHGLSPSGLAKKAGLDPTAFNPSKRHGPDGRERWPTTESVSKVLASVGTTVDEFVILLTGRKGMEKMRTTIPLIGFAKAGKGGYFDDAGFPVGSGWDEITVPGVKDLNAYALEISGDSMQPVYRQGDIIIVSPNASIRRGDRVVVRTKRGEVMAKILQRQTSKAIELASFNPDHEVKSVQTEDVVWIARIIWASQ
ncbi:MAG TPA: helix-turn-helix transcriptional regulator [Aestuariivirgaceae bacterium]|jgi:phage repressor protein C with HTH and peptisase S24 domain